MCVCAGGPGFGKAKSVLLLYLQGGPSHLDLWDPKDNVPDKPSRLRISSPEISWALAMFISQPDISNSAAMTLRLNISFVLFCFTYSICSCPCELAANGHRR